MMNELMNMYVELKGFMGGLTLSDVGAVLTGVTTIGGLFAMSNGILSFTERFTEKKFTWKRKKKDEKKEEKEDTLEASETLNKIEVSKSDSNVADVLALISYTDIECIEKMEAVIITDGGIKIPIKVEDLSSSRLIEMNFAFIEKAKYIEYIRLEGVLYTYNELVDKIEIGTK